MRQLLLVVAVALVVAALPGCLVFSGTTECHACKLARVHGPLSNDFNVGLGDKAMVEGQAQEALNKYAAAVNFTPALAENEEFQKRVSRAKATLAYQEGNRLAGESQWDAAVLKYAESVGADATFEAAQQAQGLARKQASTVHYAKGLEQARAGRSGEAAGEFQMALNYDPDNRAAKIALEDSSPRKSPGGAAPAAKAE